MRWKKRPDGVHADGNKAGSKSQGRKVVQMGSKLPRGRNKGLTEEALQIQVCKWMNIRHPMVYFVCDGSGLFTSKVSAARFAKQRPAQFKTLDLTILYPSKGYHGLVIELKNGHDKLLNKDGKLKRNDHLEAQHDTICHLADLNYKATFCCTFDEAVQTIENYLKL